MKAVSAYRRTGVWAWIRSTRYPEPPQDAELLEAISRGEFSLNGLRNRNLCDLLYRGSYPAEERQRQSATCNLLKNWRNL